VIYRDRISDSVYDHGMARLTTHELFLLQRLDRGLNVLPVSRDEYLRLARRGYVNAQHAGRHTHFRLTERGYDALEEHFVGLGDPDDTDEWIRVTPRTRGFEEFIRPAVWSMVQSTYAKIGLILDNPHELDEYDVWDVYEDRDGVLRAFRLGKTTPYGIKGGLVGSDGSKQGRAAVRAYAAQWYKEPGNYSEVSHRMEELAIEAGSPVVCAIYAPEILRKNVSVEDDGVHYRRSIKNVGEVTKVLVGRPRGIPVTSGTHPRCPVPNHMMGGTPMRVRADASNEALFEHAASIVDL
jgi:hypothetical protein